MIVLGALLILLAVGAGVFASIASGSNTQTVELTAVGVTIHATPLALYLAGVLSLLLVVCGLALVKRGAHRRAEVRRELRSLRQERVTQPRTDAPIERRAAPDVHDGVDRQRAVPEGPTGSGGKAEPPRLR